MPVPSMGQNRTHINLLDKLDNLDPWVFFQGLGNFSLSNFFTVCKKSCRGNEFAIITRGLSSPVRIIIALLNISHLNLTFKRKIITFMKRIWGKFDQGVIWVFLIFSAAKRKPTPLPLS
jgi:hypothetical protein